MWLLLFLCSSGKKQAQCGREGPSFGGVGSFLIAIPSSASTYCAVWFGSLLPRATGICNKKLFSSFLVKTGSCSQRQSTASAPRDARMHNSSQESGAGAWGHGLSGCAFRNSPPSLQASVSQLSFIDIHTRVRNIPLPPPNSLLRPLKHTDDFSGRGQNLKRVG